MPNRPPAEGQLDRQVKFVRWRYNSAYSQLELSVSLYPPGGGRVGGQGYCYILFPTGGVYAFHDVTDLRELASAEALRSTLQDELSPPKHLSIPEMLHRLFHMTRLNLFAEYYPLVMQIRVKSDFVCKILLW